MATPRKSSTRRRASSGKPSRARSSSARVKRRAGAKRAVAARKKTVRKPVKKVVKKPVKKVTKKSVAKKKVASKRTISGKTRSTIATRPAGRSVDKVANKPVRKTAKVTVQETATKPPAAKTAVKSMAAPRKSDAKQAPKAPAAAAKSPAQASRPARPAKPEPVVRPLGVLPPESRARTKRSGFDGPRVAFPGRQEPSTQNMNDTQGAERLSDKDLKVFEERLLAERQKILRDMGHLETTVLKVNQRDSAGDLSGYSFHMADAGTDAMEREKAFLFASAEGRLLFEVNDALRRIYNGEYGDCETCGQPIARARLEAIPHARQCVACKSKEERAGRGAQ